MALLLRHLRSLLLIIFVEEQRHFQIATVTFDSLSRRPRNAQYLFRAVLLRVSGAMDTTLARGEESILKPQPKHAHILIWRFGVLR
jgi:hypothetical protein